MEDAIEFLKLYNVALSSLSYIVTLMGIPVFLYSYIRNLVEERKQKEYGTYDALDKQYIEFQQLAISYPRLNVADFELDNPPTDLSQEESMVQRVLFSILISLFERAYLMYKDKSRTIRRSQWSGWDIYIEKYCRRPSFVAAWFNGQEPDPNFSAEFDEDFERYMRAKFRKVGVLK